MLFTDEAIILSVRKYSESSAILSFLSQEHGRYHGVIRGATGKRLRGVLEPGNRVQASWKARLPEHMGSVTCEPVESVAPWLLDSRIKLSALQAAAALIEQCLTEREAHPELYHDLLQLLNGMKQDNDWLPAYVRLELDILALSGFGLDLSQCAATGRQQELVYVSPRSGRAVCNEAGAPYSDKLLPLPEFLLEERQQGKCIEPQQIIDGLKLTGYFLESRVFAAHDRQMPEARKRFTRLIALPALPCTTEVSCRERADGVPKAENA